MQVLLELCNSKRLLTYFKIQKHEIIYSLTVSAMTWREFYFYSIYQHWLGKKK